MNTATGQMQPTSSGPDDILPWGVEECIDWYTPFPQYGTQRPLAWTQGTLNQETCRYENQKVRTSGRAGQTGAPARASLSG